MLKNVAVRQTWITFQCPPRPHSTHSHSAFTVNTICRLSETNPHISIHIL